MERFPVVPESEILPEMEDGSEGGMTDTSRSTSGAAASAGWPPPPPLMRPEAAKGMVGVEVRFRDILTSTLLNSDHLKNNLGFFCCSSSHHNRFQVIPSSRPQTDKESSFTATQAEVIPFSARNSRF